MPSTFFSQAKVVTAAEWAEGVTTADVSTHSPFTSVNSKQWAPEQGIPPVTASRCFPSGTLPVPARRVGHLIPGNAPA